MATAAKAAPPPAAPPPPSVPALVVELVPVGSIKPDPNNAREHNDRNLQAITASLKAFGQQKAIVVDRDGVVRAGNGTLTAAMRLGWTHINIVRTTLDAEQARAYSISDNRTGDLSYFDEGVLADALRGVPEIDVGAMGFDDAEVADILAAVGDPVDEVTAPDKAQKSAQVLARRAAGHGAKKRGHRGERYLGHGSREPRVRHHDDMRVLPCL